MSDPMPRKDVELPPRMPEAGIIAELRAELAQARDDAQAAVARAEKAEQERVTEWNRRRDAEGSRNAAFAACDTMRAERDRLAAANVALEAKLARLVGSRDAVRVKPLEWGHGEAHCPLGVYKIDSGQASGGGRWWSWALNPDESDPFFMWQNANNADSEEAAKAAAQADYEARILAALEVTP
jgi:hypothetical protein